MSDNFPVQHPCDYLIGRPAVCCAARLTAFRVVLQIPQARHARHVAEILASFVEFKLYWGSKRQVWPILLVDKAWVAGKTG